MLQTYAILLSNLRLSSPLYGILKPKNKNMEETMHVNGGVKTSQLAAQKSTTADRRLERPVERARQGVLSSSDW